jgi:hypothetical protein
MVFTKIMFDLDNKNSEKFFENYLKINLTGFKNL